MTTSARWQRFMGDLRGQEPESHLLWLAAAWRPRPMAPESLKLDRNWHRRISSRSLTEQITAAGGKFYLYLDSAGRTGGRRRILSPEGLWAMSIANANLLGYNRGKC